MTGTARSRDDADGHAALALLDGLLALLVDKGMLGSDDRKALIVATMDRMQRGGDPSSLAALDALQRMFVDGSDKTG